MPRVTPTEVREIIDTKLTDARIEIFITGATTLVNNKLVGKGLDDPTLKEIERWLSAHNIAANIDRQVIHEEAGRGAAVQKFSDIFGQYLLSTTYGQTAITLDPTGTLEEIAQARRPIKLISIPER